MFFGTITNKGMKNVDDKIEKKILYSAHQKYDICSCHTMFCFFVFVFQFFDFFVNFFVFLFFVFFVFCFVLFLFCRKSKNIFTFEPEL